MGDLHAVFTPSKNTLAHYRANKPGFAPRKANKKPGLFALVVFLFLTGCAPQVTGIASPAKTEIALDATHALGQTFTAHHVGLNGIEIFLAPNPAAPNTTNANSITLTLKAYRTASDVLATAQLNAAAVQTPAYYRFNFAPLSNSRNNDYFVEITTHDQTTLQVGSATGDAYMDGALYQNGAAQEAQLAFRLVYDRTGMVVGFIRQLGEWAKVLFATFIVVIVPGLILLASWRGWPGLSWLERLSLACGVGLALIPVLLLWAQLFNSLAILAIACICFLLWLLWRVLKKRNADLATASDLAGFGKPARSSDRSRTANTLLPQLCAVLVLLIVIITRFQAIGSLDIPMWGDSYHHTLITQLIVDHTGLFDSWQPYADLNSFTYHFGFHGLAAAIHLITGFSTPQATLWAGQVCNVLAVFALYALAIKLSDNNAWAGVVAMLVAGLLSPMPMFYMNWGRYTQLAGQVILCTAVYLLWWMAEARTHTLGAALLLALVLAGLALTHYRVLVFALVFASVCILFVLMTYARARRSGNPAMSLRNLFISAMLCGAVALVLFVPWLVHVANSSLANDLFTLLRTPATGISDTVSNYNSMGSFSLYQSSTLWGVLLICFVLGLVQRQLGVLGVGLWWLLIFVITNPHWLGLPGTGAVSNFASLIAIYIPTSLISGLVIGKAINSFNSANNSANKPGLFALLARGGQGIAALLVMAMGLQGATWRLADVQLNTGVLVTRADLRAAAWIRAHLPPSAYLLVNTFTAYNGTLSVGTDGGWWLPLLAGRRTTLPPALYNFEQPLRPGFEDEVAHFAKLATAPNVSQPSWATTLKSLGITHVFVGQRQGRVNYGGPNLDPQQLSANTGLRVVYHEDRVWIFEVI